MLDVGQVLLLYVLEQGTQKFGIVVLVLMAAGVLLALLGLV